MEVLSGGPLEKEFGVRSPIMPPSSDFYTKYFLGRPLAREHKATGPGQMLSVTSV